MLKSPNKFRRLVGKTIPRYLDNCLYKVRVVGISETKCREPSCTCCPTNRTLIEVTSEDANIPSSINICFSIFKGITDEFVVSNEDIYGGENASTLNNGNKN